MYYCIFVGTNLTMTYSPADAAAAGSRRHVASERRARVFARWIAAQNPGAKVQMCYYDDPLPDAMSIEDEVIQPKDGTTTFYLADVQYNAELNRCYLLLGSDGAIYGTAETEAEAQQWQRQAHVMWDPGATYRLGTLRDFGEVEEVSKEG